MKHAMPIALAVLAAGLMPSVAAEPAGAARSATAITCNWPVGPNDSARTLLRHFGPQARMADIGVGEGETQRGVELFFNDRRRRMAVLFQDPERRHPEKVYTISDRAPWTVAGIRMGDSLESVRQRNGRAFTLQMFGADYAGYLHSFEGGALETVMGHCQPWIVFDDNSEEMLPEGLMGDGETSSDHPGMGKARATVGTLGVRFAASPETGRGN